MIDRRRFNLIRFRSRAAAGRPGAGAVAAERRAQQDARSWPAQVEAPVYRNVGLANPYSINNEDFRGSIINMFEPLFYYNSNKNEVIPWVATGLENTRRFLLASPSSCATA